MKFGLRKDIIQKINDVFASEHEVKEVILYGSRAKGNYKPGSDIDLTLKGGNLNLDILNRINLKLDELLLPYTFDISIYKYINNIDLLEHIQRVGIVFFKQPESFGSTEIALKPARLI